MASKFIVLLTGGIASGKTTVSRCFQQLGIVVVDTDDIAHQLTAAQGLAISSLCDIFGAEILSADGALDRARMRERVFNHPEALAQLEGVLHPLIRQAALDQVAQAQSPYVVLVVPLFVEKPYWQDKVARVLVIDCAESLQIERLLRDRQLSPDVAQSILSHQCQRHERLKYADDVILNAASEDSLSEQIIPLHHRYLALAQQCVE